MSNPPMWAYLTVISVQPLAGELWFFNQWDYCCSRTALHLTNDYRLYNKYTVTCRVWHILDLRSCFTCCFMFYFVTSALRPLHFLPVHLWPTLIGISLSSPLSVCVSPFGSSTQTQCLAFDHFNPSGLCLFWLPVSLIVLAGKGWILWEGAFESYYLHQT